MSSFCEKEHLPKQQNGSNNEEVASCAPEYLRPLFTITSQNVILGNPEEMEKRTSKLYDISEPMRMEASKMNDIPELIGKEVSKLHDIPELMGKEASKLHNILELMGKEASKVHQVPELMGKEVSKLHDIPELMGKESSKLYNILELLGKEASKLHQVPELIGKDASKLQDISELLGKEVSKLHDIVMRKEDSNLHAIPELMGKEASKLHDILEQIGKEASKLQDIPKLMQQISSESGRRCADCGNKIKESQGEKCTWCVIMKKLNEEPSTTRAECENKGRGCPYRWTGNKPLISHHTHFCKHRDHSCYYCKQKLPSGTSRAEHMVKYHGTDLTAVVKDDSASIEFSLQSHFDWYHYYIHARNIVIYMEVFYKSDKVIEFYIVVVADNHGGDFMTITADITNPNAIHAITTHIPAVRNHDDWQRQNLDISSLNLLTKAKLNIKLTINVKK